MTIHWRESMSIDGGAIDTDHKFLILLINEFESEFEKGFDQFRLLDALKRLEYYTVYHFSREEAIQQRIGFPHHKEHAEQHRQLRMNVKGAIRLFGNPIPEANRDRVKSNVMRLLKMWIVGHIAKFDIEMKPNLGNRTGTAHVGAMQKSGDDGSHEYRLLFSKRGKSMAVQVVQTDAFVGMSFGGFASMEDAKLLVEACEIINGLTQSVIVACMEHLNGFDEYFIGHLLTVLGTFIEGGRGINLVIGSEGACTDRLKKLGIDRIVRSFPSNGDFYLAVGFQT